MKLFINEMHTAKFMKGDIKSYLSLIVSENKRFNNYYI